MGQDVQEIVGLCVQVPCKVLSTSTDIVMMMLRALADRHRVKAQGRAAEAAASAKYPYYIGSGKVDPATFNRIEGHVDFLSVDREDINDLEDAFKSYGLTWTVVKGKDDQINVMVHGREEAIQAALVSIAPSLGVDEEELEQAQECEPESKEFPAVMNRHKLDWTKVQHDGEIAYTAINGSYDIIAAANGSWAVRQADKIVQSGQASNGGLYSAMFYGNCAANDLKHIKERQQGVTFANPTSGVPSHDATNDVYSLMDHAAARAEAHNKAVAASTPDIVTKPIQPKK